MSISRIFTYFLATQEIRVGSLIFNRSWVYCHRYMLCKNFMDGTTTNGSRIELQLSTYKIWLYKCYFNNKESGATISYKSYWYKTPLHTRALQQGHHFWISSNAISNCEYIHKTIAQRYIQLLGSLFRYVKLGCSTLGVHHIFTALRLIVKILTIEQYQYCFQKLDWIKILTRISLISRIFFHTILFQNFYFNNKSYFLFLILPLFYISCYNCMSTHIKKNDWPTM